MDWRIADAARHCVDSTGHSRQDQTENHGWEEDLTERERETAHHIARGASNKEIARELGITERTVKAHVGAILEKLNLRDRLQIALRVNGQTPA